MKGYGYGMKDENGVDAVPPSGARLARFASIAVGIDDSKNIATPPPKSSTATFGVRHINVALLMASLWALPDHKEQ